jgi:LacI family transcriptional regulator
LSTFRTSVKFAEGFARKPERWKGARKRSIRDTRRPQCGGLRWHLPGEPIVAAPDYRRPPLLEMGRVATRSLAQMISNDVVGTRHIELATRLVVRDSTAPLSG